MRVVVDTNVFVSSFFGGNPRKIIDLWAAGEITLCLSRQIVEEYIKVLERLGLQEDEGLGALLNLLARGHSCLFTTKTPQLNIVDADPDEDKFIACAVALEAQWVISGDRHLTAVKEYMRIKIVTPKQFVDQFSNMSN